MTSKSNIEFSIMLVGLQLMAFCKLSRGLNVLDTYFKLKLVIFGYSNGDNKSAQLNNLQGFAQILKYKQIEFQEHIQ